MCVNIFKNYPKFIDKKTQICQGIKEEKLFLKISIYYVFVMLG